jgi:hypothetical protein
MNLIETDQLEGEGIIITPKDGNYDNVVFWFHGLGQAPSLAISMTIV